ncbi:hypothetical protein D3C75_572510 [compost metagenome]
MATSSLGSASRYAGSSTPASVSNLIIRSSSQTLIRTTLPEKCHKAAPKAAAATISSRATHIHHIENTPEASNFSAVSRNIFMIGAGRGKSNGFPLFTGGCF